MAAAANSWSRHFAETHTVIVKAWADSSYRTQAIDHGARLNIEAHVVQPDRTTSGATTPAR